MGGVAGREGNDVLLWVGVVVVFLQAFHFAFHKSSML